MPGTKKELKRKEGTQEAHKRSVQRPLHPHCQPDVDEPCLIFTGIAPSYGRPLDGLTVMTTLALTHDNMLPVVPGTV